MNKYTLTSQKNYNGPISSLALLDLRTMKRVEELKHITSISSVDVILLSDNFQGTLASIPMSSVDSIISLSENSRVNHMSGTFKLDGKFLENNDADVLLITGEMFITTPPKKIGYKNLIVTGNLFMPRGSENIVTPYLVQSSGQVIAYSPTQSKIFIGNENFDSNFFESLNHSISLVLIGNFKIDRGVSTKLFGEKVLDVICIGVLKVQNKEMVSLLNVLIADRVNALIEIEDNE